ncbi:hypothetical protein [Mesorhizobium sp. M0977]|uniref:hypothetical protein n=1 Tax=unclassified Mesorhizobium TaxID=325217 RepID=UPI003337047F
MNEVLKADVPQAWLQRVVSFVEMEKKLSKQTPKSGEMRGLAREQLAAMLGLSTGVFAIPRSRKSRLSAPARLPVDRPHRPIGIGLQPRFA